MSPSTRQSPSKMLSSQTSWDMPLQMTSVRPPFAIEKKKKGGAYIQIPHDPQPVNEFFHSKLFPKMYPTLFPYGIGGFEDQTRLQTIAFERHVKHLFNLTD